MMPGTNDRKTPRHVHREDECAGALLFSGREAKSAKGVPSWSVRARLGAVCYLDDRHDARFCGIKLRNPARG